MTTKYEFEWVELDGAWDAHEGNQGGFQLNFGCKGFGFGTLTFFRDHEGKLKCDNERLDLNFIEQALLHFARTAILIN